MAMWVAFLILENCNLVKTAIGQELNLKLFDFYDPILLILTFILIPFK